MSLPLSVQSVSSAVLMVVAGMVKGLAAAETEAGGGMEVSSLTWP